MDKQHYMIICTGRDGSSLLSATLSDCGANFGTQHTQDWDPRAGAYESWAVAKATAHYDYFIDLNAVSFLSPFVRVRRRVHRIFAKAWMKRHLSKATYTKIGTAYRLPQLARLVGYEPRIIILYRDYRTQFASAYVRKPFTYSALCNKYHDTLATGLLSLSIYGGCVIRYEDMIDPTATAWAKLLAELTGFTETALLESRAKIVKFAPHETASEVVPRDNKLDELMTTLRNKSGIVHSSGRLGARG